MNELKHRSNGSIDFVTENKIITFLHYGHNQTTIQKTAISIEQKRRSIIQNEVDQVYSSLRQQVENESVNVKVWIFYGIITIPKQPRILQRQRQRRLTIRTKYLTPTLLVIQPSTSTPTLVRFVNPDRKRH